MPRRYNVSFEQVSVSVAQDLVQITGATGKILRIIEVGVACSDTTTPASQLIPLRCRFLPATVTNGSGGSTPAYNKLDPGDASASFTGLVNSTTKATTGGTALVLHEDATHVFATYCYQFPTPPVVGPSEAFVFELLSAPTGTVKFSGRVLVEEIGG